MGDNRQEKDGANNGDQTVAAPNHAGEEVAEHMAPAKRTPSPAFQFYPKDFLSSSKVQRMSLTEVGIYVLLLSRSWLDGGLPTSVPEIAKLLKMPQTRFAKLWRGVLSECFIERNGRLVNPRLEQARKDQAAYRQKQKENADKGWQTRGKQVAMPPHQSGNALHLQSPSASPSSTATPTAKLKKEDPPPDIAFRAFQDAYPPSRRKGGRLVEEAFMFAAQSAGGAEALMVALANHTASEQWRNTALVPAMDKWLAEERWRQTLPAPGESATPLSSKVADPMQAWLERKAVGE